MKLVRLLAATLLVSLSFVITSPTQSVFAANTLHCRFDVCGGIPLVHVFVDWWGPEWGGAGFSADGVTSTEYQTYVTDFLHLLQNDSTYLSILNQYVGSNSSISFGGQWNDTGSDPHNRYSMDDAKAEVARAQAHFGDVDPDETTSDVFVIASPPGRSGSGFATNGGPYCSYHDPNGYTVGFHPFGPDRYAPFIELDFQPDADGHCWDGHNPTDSFGHGSLDGVSSVLSHEISETLTDWNVGNGWLSDTGAFCVGVCFGGEEIGDLCNGEEANFGSPDTAAYPDNYFASQLEWSNALNACAMQPQGQASLSTVAPFSQVVGTSSTAQHVTATNTGHADLADGALLSSASPWVLDDPSHSFTVSNDDCPPVLHPGETCGADIQFTPSAVGTATATLWFPCQGPSNLFCAAPDSITLTGHAQAPQLFVVPPYVAHLFGSDCTVCRAHQQVIHFTNTTGSEMTLSGASLAGQYAKNFSMKSNKCGSSGAAVKLPPKAVCTVTLVFRPRATGAMQALLTFSTAVGPYSTVVGGSGVGPAVKLSGKYFSNGQVTFPESEGLAKGKTTLTLRSNGKNPLTLSGMSLSGPFAQKNNCPKVMPVGHHCSITLTMHPKLYNAQRGLLSIRDDAPNAPQKFTLAGTAVGSMAAVDPANIDFGPVQAGTFPSESLQLSNVEDGLDINSITISGPFTETTTCPKKGEIFGTCNITVKLNTQKLGEATGSLAISTRAINGNLKVPLKVLVANLSKSQTGLKVAPNPADTKSDIMATATVSPVSSNGLPTGTVSFNVGGQFTDAPLVNGVATLDVGQMPPGKYDVIATYEGDSSFGSSTSNDVEEIVNQ